MGEFVVGDNKHVTKPHSTVIGDRCYVMADDCYVQGNRNIVYGHRARVVGNDNVIRGQDAVVEGERNDQASSAVAAGARQGRRERSRSPDGKRRQLSPLRSPRHDEEDGQRARMHPPVPFSSSSSSSSLHRHTFTRVSANPPSMHTTPMSIGQLLRERFSSPSPRSPPRMALLETALLRESAPPRLALEEALWNTMRMAALTPDPPAPTSFTTPQSMDDAWIALLNRPLPTGNGSARMHPPRIIDLTRDDNPLLTDDPFVSFRGWRGAHPSVTTTGHSSSSSSLSVDEWMRQRPPATPSPSSSLPEQKRTATSTTTTAPAGGTMCSICMERPVRSLTLPCAHASSCRECLVEWLKQKRECPVCRTPVAHIQDFFLSGGMAGCSSAAPAAAHA
jgi:hypothetical protein